MTDGILMQTLQKHGLERFDPSEKGEKFNPNLHEATFQTPVEGKEDGTVFHTQQKGFILNGRVVRVSGRYSSRTCGILMVTTGCQGRRCKECLIGRLTHNVNIRVGFGFMQLYNILGMSTGVFGCKCTKTPLFFRLHIIGT